MFVLVCGLLFVYVCNGKKYNNFGSSQSIYNQLLFLHDENYDSFNANDKYMLTEMQMDDDLDESYDRLYQGLYINTMDDMDKAHMERINHKLAFNMDNDEKQANKHSQYSIFYADNEKGESQKLNYRAAQHYCRSVHGTNLVTVGGPEKNAKMAQTGQAGWIGLRERGGWQSQSRSKFRNWRRGESHKQGCVLMDKDGKWKRDPCTKPNFFWCDRQDNVADFGRGGMLDDGGRYGLSYNARWLDNDIVSHCNFKEENHQLARSVSYIKLRPGHNYKKGQFVLILPRDKNNLLNKGCNVAALKIVRITKNNKAYVRDAAPTEYIPSADFSVTSDNNRMGHKIRGTQTFKNLPKGVLKKLRFGGRRPPRIFRRVRRRPRRQLFADNDEMFDDDENDDMWTNDNDNEENENWLMDERDELEMFSKQAQQELFEDYQDLMGDSDNDDIMSKYEYNDDDYIDDLNSIYDDDMDDDMFHDIYDMDDNDEEWRRRRRRSLIRVRVPSVRIPVVDQVTRTVTDTAETVARTTTDVVNTATRTVASYATAGASAFRSGWDEFEEKTTRVWGDATRAVGSFVTSLADNIAIGGRATATVSLPYKDEYTKSYNKTAETEVSFGSIGTLTIEAEGTITLTAGVDFDISLSFELGGRWSLISAGIEWIKAVAKLTHHLLFEFNLKLEAKLESRLDFLEIGTPNPISMVIGVVPIVFRPYMQPYVGFDVEAELNFNFQVGYQNVLFEVGFLQEGSKFSAINNAATPEFVKNWSITNGDGTCGITINMNPHIGAEFLVTIYGTFTTGVDIRVNGNAQLALPIEKGGTTCGNNPLYGGLSMEPNIELYLIARVTEIFGIELPESAQLDKNYLIVTIPITKFTVYFQMPGVVNTLFRTICQCRRRRNRRRLANLSDYWKVKQAIKKNNKRKYRKY